MVGAKYCRNYIRTVNHVLCREVSYTVPLFGRVHYQRLHCVYYIHIHTQPLGLSGWHKVAGCHPFLVVDSIKSVLCPYLGEPLSESPLYAVF